MNLPLLDFPSETDDWPAWLERQFFTADLGELVDELTIVLDFPERGPTLAEILGDSLPEVLQIGLKALSPDQLRLLLKHPTRLVELQEEILYHGGDYWTARLQGAISSEEVTASWEQLQPHLSVRQESPVTEAAQPVPKRLPTWAVVIGSLAAGLLIGISLWRPATPEPWGWNRPGVLAAEFRGDAYLEHLAEAADEYFLRPRDNAADLERQLADFHRGCEALLAAPLDQITDADRDWLRERCRAWAEALDTQRQELLTNARPFEEVRADADETIRKLSAALRQRLA